MENQDIAKALQDLAEAIKGNDSVQTIKVTITLTTKNNKA